MSIPYTLKRLCYSCELTFAQGESERQSNKQTKKKVHRFICSSVHRPCNTVPSTVRAAFDGYVEKGKVTLSRLKKKFPPLFFLIYSSYHSGHGNILMESCVEAVSTRNYSLKLIYCDREHALPFECWYSVPFKLHEPTPELFKR